MPRLQQYVIQNANGQFYTVCDIVGAKDVIEVDGTGNKYVHSRHVLAPRFDTAMPSQASMFGSQQDAKDMMANSQLADPAAFANCSVVAFDD